MFFMSRCDLLLAFSELLQQIRHLFFISLAICAKPTYLLFCIRQFLLLLELLQFQFSSDQLCLLENVLYANLSHPFFICVVTDWLVIYRCAVRVVRLALLLQTLLGVRVYVYFVERPILAGNVQHAVLRHDASSLKALAVKLNFSY